MIAHGWVKETITFCSAKVASGCNFRGALRPLFSARLRFFNDYVTGTGRQVGEQGKVDRFAVEMNRSIGHGKIFPAGMEGVKAMADS